MTLPTHPGAELDLKGLRAANHTQPMAIDLENDNAIVRVKPPTSTGSGETTGRDVLLLLTTNEVHAHAITCTADAY